MLKLAVKGYEALQRKDFKTAENAFRLAMQHEPDAPDLLNNLGIALERQGRQEESEALLLEVQQRFPNYFFSCLAAANVAKRDGDLKKAREILTRLAQRQKLHISEFRALANAEVDLAIKQGTPQAAECWLEMWERVEPDHPDLARLRLRLSFFSQGTK